MKLTKIMTDLLKAVEKDKTSTINYGEDEDYVYLLPNDKSAYRIPKKSFLIDLKKALPTKIPLTNPAKFFDVDVEEARKTSHLKMIPGKKPITVVKIAGESKHAWVDVDLLKNFENCTFGVSSVKSPVLVYESGELVGVVLPVYMKEDRNDQI